MVDEQIPNLMIESSKENIKYRGVPHTKFFEKMGTQSSLDLRAILEILTSIFLREGKLKEHYCNAQLHSLLKQFHQFFSTLNPSGDQELQVPHSRDFYQLQPLTQDEEESLLKYDYQEFLYPYKRVSSSSFIFLSTLSDPEVLDSLRGMLSMFLTSIYRPEHIREELLALLIIFGKHGLSAADQLLLN